MRLKFSKMHGLGNDFIVIDGISQKVRLSEEKIRQISDRHTGIGCDQLLLVETPSSPDIDFRYRIYNCDGTEVENCGNGARCFAVFVRERQLTGKSRIKVETANGEMELIVRENDQVTVNMGAPRLNPSDLPFDAPAQAASYDLRIETIEGSVDLSIGAVSMGNPHAVTLVDSTDSAPVETWGPLIEGHSRFAKRVNAGFMEIKNRSEVNLRVFERGVGETQACGTGACGAVVAGIVQGHLDAKVAVNLPGGRLHIEWQGGNNPVLMTGPAVTVFHGQIKI
jgi:diaminopimelate epimerase